MATTTNPTTLDLRSSADAIAGVLAANAAESERSRRVSPASVEAMAAAGLWRVLTPRTYGGEEAGLRTQVDTLLVTAAADPAALLTALEEAYPEAEARVMPGGTVRLPHHADQAEQVLRTLVSADVWPTRLAREGESLESFFLSVIGGERA